MPISLAEFLEPRPRPEGNQERSPDAGGPAAAAQNVPGGTSPAGGRQVSQETLDELKALLGELSSEWEAVVKAVGAYKQEIRGESPFAAPPPAPKPGAPRATPSQPKPQAAPRPVAAQPGPGKPTRSTAAGEKAKPSAPASGEPTASAAAPDLNAKLGELLKLLKESVASRESSRPQPVELPHQVTRAIAREVADQVLESIGSGGGGPLPAAREAARPAAPTGPKKIPIGDLNALIEQLTSGQGGPRDE